MVFILMLKEAMASWKRSGYSLCKKRERKKNIIKSHSLWLVSLRITASIYLDPSSLLGFCSI